MLRGVITLSVVLALTAATPSIASAEAPATTRPVSDATSAAREALRQFLAASYSDHPSAATRFCYARDAHERAVASAMALLARGQVVCRSAVADALGTGAANDVFAHLVLPEHVPGAAAVAAGRRVTFSLATPHHVRFPMVRVAGQWKLSVAEYLRMNGLPDDDFVRTAARLSRAFTAMAEEIRAGRYATADHLAAALSANLQRSLEPPDPSQTAAADE
jgi:hypothetical protein